MRLRVGEIQKFGTRGWEVQIVKLTRDVYAVSAFSPNRYSYYALARIKYHRGCIEQVLFKADPNNLKDAEVLVYLLGDILGNDVVSREESSFLVG